MLPCIIEKWNCKEFLCLSGNVLNLVLFPYHGEYIYIYTLPAIRIMYSFKLIYYCGFNIEVVLSFCFDFDWKQLQGNDFLLLGLTYTYLNSIRI